MDVPEQTVMEAFVEKGFWYALGLIATITMTAVGVAANNTSSYRKGQAEMFKEIHARVDRTYKKIADHRTYVAEHYPDKEDFKMMMRRMEKGFDDLKKELKEVKDAGV